MDERVREELKFALAKMTANTKGVAFWSGQFISVKVTPAPAEKPERFAIEIALAPLVGNGGDLDGSVITLVGINAVSIHYADVRNGAARFDDLRGGFYKIRLMKLAGEGRGD